MWETTSPSTLKDGIFTELRRLGATRMEAYYSGGNDEGGVDDVVVSRPAGKREYLLHTVRRNWKGEPERNTYPSHGPYSTKKEANAAGRAFAKNGKSYDRSVLRFEPVLFEGEFVPLLDADVGNWENGLLRLVDDLLSIDFGTWAGDFSASGVVHADLTTRRVWREGTVSTYIDDPAGGEY